MCDYLRIDEEENAVDSLERVASFISEKTSIKWKWVSIALDMALYSFCICALKGTNPNRVLIEGKKKEPKKESLISFNEVIKRISQEQWMKQNVHSKPIVLSASQRRSIDILHKELRNRFIHYEPLSWSLVVSGMPAIAKDVIDVIEELVFGCGNIQLENEQITRVRQSIDDIMPHINT